MTITYNKLVRDRIPEIIRESGKEAVTEVLSDIEYIKMLDEKLTEELNEYQESNDIEELSDMLEVSMQSQRQRAYQWLNLKNCVAIKRTNVADLIKKYYLKK